MSLKRHLYTPWLFLLPALVLLIIFYFYPLVETFLLSFQTNKRGQLIFVGLDNYIRLFKDQYFWKALGNSLIYLAIQVPIMISLAIIMAVALHRGVKWGKKFFRLAFFLPVVVEAVSYSLIFVLLFQDIGLINYLLSFLKIDSVPWLTQSWPARILVMTVMTWRWTGYNMVMILAGLQFISDDYYEAARIEGANKLQQFFKITLPLLQPVILFCLILSTIGTVNLFTEPYILTGGGPNNATMSMGLYIYRQAFQSINFTYAATISVAILIIVGSISFIQLKLGDKQND